jgi:glucose 1-dehydrogenase
MNVLQDRVAIVTGAAQGLGLAIARRFVEEGSRVLLADLNGEVVTRAAEALGQVAFVLDVAKREEVERMVAFATDHLGPVDVLVNNAGIYRNTPLLDLGEQEFDRIMSVNVKSALFAIQAVAPGMIARRRGSIVNVASVAAVLGAPGTAAYCVSKAGLAQLTNVAAIELAPHNVRVNAVGPGTFATEMAQDAYADEMLRNRILPRTPLGRLGRPEEAAGVALFLASDDSSYVTGKTIYADGGRMGLNLML